MTGEAGEERLDSRSRKKIRTQRRGKTGPGKGFHRCLLTANSTGMHGHGKMITFCERLCTRR